MTVSGTHTPRLVLSMHMVAILSPSGAVHFLGRPPAPRRMPSSAPRVAQVQSVSSPQALALQIWSPKSSPYSQPAIT